MNQILELSGKDYFDKDCDLDYFKLGWKEGSDVTSLSHVRLFATPWIVAYQASPSTGFSRQGY